MGRRIFSKLLFVFIISAFLCSCYSLYESDDGIPEYTAKLYSTSFAEEDFDPTKKVLVYCNYGDPMMQTVVEHTFVDSLNEIGIDAISTYELKPNPAPELFEEPLIPIDSYSDIYLLAYFNNIDYVVFISFSDVYTYEYGGGLSQLYFEIGLAKYNAYDYLEEIKVSGSLNCVENKFQSYIESMDYAFESLADSVVTEFLQYAKSE